jgi:hypothetical protein
MVRHQKQECSFSEIKVRHHYIAKQKKREKIKMLAA